MSPSLMSNKFSFTKMTGEFAKDATNLLSGCFALGNAKYLESRFLMESKLRIPKLKSKTIIHIKCNSQSTIRSSGTHDHNCELSHRDIWYFSSWWVTVKCVKLPGNARFRSKIFSLKIFLFAKVLECSQALKELKSFEEYTAIILQCNDETAVCLPTSLFFRIRRCSLPFAAHFDSFPSLKSAAPDRRLEEQLRNPVSSIIKLID